MTIWTFIVLGLWLITSVRHWLRILELHGRVANAERFEEQAHKMNDRLNAEVLELKQGFFPDWGNTE